MTMRELGRPHAWPDVPGDPEEQDEEPARDELIGHSIDILNSVDGTPAERVRYTEQLRQDKLQDEQQD